MKNSSKVIFYIFFIALVVGLFGVMSFHFRERGDFPDHMEWVKQQSENGYMYKVPRTLYQKMVVVVRALLPANVLVWNSVWIKQVYDLKSFEISSIILMTLTYLSVALILVRQLLKEWKESRSKRLLWWAGMGALVIMLVAPVFIFSLPRMFLGYAAGNRFDSPSYIMAKPFVILTFFAVVHNLFKKWNWTNSLWMAAFMMLATIAKPNFTITFLPALAIVLVTFYLKKWKGVNWLYIIFPMGLTALIVLIGQYSIQYVGDRGDRMIFSPFEAILYLTDGSLSNVFIFLFMSLLFPLAAVILYWRSAKKDLSMQLAVINFLVALTYGLLLGEKIDISVALFWNCVQFGSFVLFMATVVFFGKKLIERFNNGEKFRWREWTVSALLAAHFICGVVYYVASLAVTGIIKI